MDREADSETWGGGRLVGGCEFRQQGFPEAEYLPLLSNSMKLMCGEGISRAGDVALSLSPPPPRDLELEEDS